MSRGLLTLAILFIVLISAFLFSKISREIVLSFSDNSSLPQSEASVLKHLDGTEFFDENSQNNQIEDEESSLIESKNWDSDFSPSNYCLEETEFFEEEDRIYCHKPPYLTEPKGVEINLATKKVLLYNDNKLIKVLPLLYQSPENRWMQSPTGFFRAKIKEKLHWSTIGRCWLPYSIQYYEDFFLHGIPYYPNGEKISTTVSGGCLRFQDDVMEQIYNFLKTNDQVLVYSDFSNLKLKEGFHSPVNIEESFILSRFYTPYRRFRRFGGDRENLKLDYYNHTGVDFKLKPGADDLNVYAIYDGQVSRVITLGEDEDYGMGNTIIIEHNINNQKVYSLYAHLSYINPFLKIRKEVEQGEVIGEIGNSGYGCLDYWRISENGCKSSDILNPHLHFEIKTAPVLENPQGDKKCIDSKGQNNYCYRYAPDPLFSLGYFNPIDFLFEKE